MKVSVRGFSAYFSFGDVAQPRTRAEPRTTSAARTPSRAMAFRIQFLLIEFPLNWGE